MRKPINIKSFISGKIRKSVYILRRILHYYLYANVKYRVMIEASSICNAKCTFCSNSNLAREKSVMSANIFDKILNRLETENINVGAFLLHLNGEPLIDPNLFDKIRCLKSRFPNAKVGFTTNFSLADRDKVTRLFDSGLDEITISLNSLDPDEYYKIMGIPFDRTFENLKYFLSENEKHRNKIKSTISIVLREDNYVMYEQFLEKFSNLANIRAMHLGHWITSDNEREFCKYNETGTICDELHNKICFLSNGDYALCCFDSEGIIHKNVEDTSILEALDSEIYRKIRCYQLFYGRSNCECRGCSFS